MKPMFAVKDLATQAYGNPFTTRAQGEALRSFQDEANADPAKSAIAQHPEDYELYKLAEYDDEAGIIHGLPQPELIARAKDLLTPRT